MTSKLNRLMPKVGDVICPTLMFDFADALISALKEEITRMIEAKEYDGIVDIWEAIDLAYTKLKEDVK